MFTKGPPYSGVFLDNEGHDEGIINNTHEYNSVSQEDLT